MKKTFLNVLITALLVFGAMFSASPASAHWGDQARVRGVIAAVDTSAGTVSVTPRGGGADVLLNVDSSTWIKRNGQTASLADLQVGDLVNARYNPTSMLAYSIVARLNLVWVKGVIAAVDTGGGTLTITPYGGGADVLLNVDPTTTIQRNGQTASLADLQPGDWVLAQYHTTSLLASRIYAWHSHHR